MGKNKNKDKNKQNPPAGASGGKADEVIKVKEMFKNMPKRVEISSVWYVVSMKWIMAW
jgi:hypothetical protein